MSVNLQLLARQRVAEGTVHIPENFRSFGGEGSGGVCALCDSAIGRDGMEIEVEFAGSARSMYTFHVECFLAWSGARTYAS